MSQPSSLFLSYSDAASSYWPPGWNFHRFAHATPEDNKTLSDEERAKMQAGFRNVLGEDGVGELARVVWQEQLRLKRLEKKSLAAAPSLSSSAQKPRPRPPNWLQTWQKRCAAGASGPWGFVAFFVPSATMPPAEVAEFQARVREIAEIPIREALEDQDQPADEIAKAQGLFEIRWVQVERQAAQGDDQGRGDLGNLEVELPGKLRAQYHAMRESGSLPPGLDLPVFLYASPGAIASVMQTSPERVKEAHSAKSRWRSEEVPFLLVVAAETKQGVEEEDGDEEEPAGEVSGEKSWFKPAYKAAIEVLIDELWWMVEEQITTLGKMTRFVRAAKIADHGFPGEGDGGNEQETDVDPRAGDENGRREEPSYNDDGLDDIWWTVHMPPHHMKKRRRM